MFTGRLDQRARWVASSKAKVNFPRWVSSSVASRVLAASTIGRVGVVAAAVARSGARKAIAARNAIEQMALLRLGWKSFMVEV
ncbi:hypothetical protein D3C83_164130 [compost metagenome]